MPETRFEWEADLKHPYERQWWLNVGNLIYANVQQEAESSNFYANVDRYSKDDKCFDTPEAAMAWCEGLIDELLEPVKPFIKS